MSNSTTSDRPSDGDYYLPGVSAPSTAGPVERLLTRLFRRRGRF
ncbi:hypothetical protein [Haloplanus sp. C73]